MHHARPQHEPRRQPLGARTRVPPAGRRLIGARRSGQPHDAALPWLTPAGESPGHRTLRAGQAVNIHANGQVVFVIGVLATSSGHGDISIQHETGEVVP